MHNHLLLSPHIILLAITQDSVNGYWLNPTKPRFTYRSLVGSYRRLPHCSFVMSVCKLNRTSSVLFEVPVLDSSLDTCLSTDRTPSPTIEAISLQHTSRSMEEETKKRRSDNTVSLRTTSLLVITEQHEGNAIGEGDVRPTI